MLTDQITLQGNGFQLSNFKEVHKNGLEYKFDLKLDSTPFTIRNCGLFKRGEIKFIMFPSEEYIKDGVKKRKNYILAPKEFKEQLYDMISSFLKEKFKV